MRRTRGVPAAQRGCPAQCAEGLSDNQRELATQELLRLPQSGMNKVHESGWPGYVCTSCGAIYIREPYLDVPLGKLQGLLTDKWPA